MIMARLNSRKKLVSSNVVVYNNNINLLTSSVFRQASLVDEFFVDSTSDSVTGSAALSYSDPIYVLFNQERLTRLGSTAASEVLKMFMPKSDSLQSLRANCSDDDLLSMIKSRHLQSPCEILAWSNYMADNMDKFNAELANVRANSASVEPPQTE